MSLNPAEQTSLVKTTCGACGAVHETDNPTPSYTPFGWIYLRVSSAARVLSTEMQNAIGTIDTMAHETGSADAKRMADDLLALAHGTSGDDVAIDYFLCSSCALTSSVTVAELVAQMREGAEDVPGLPGGPSIEPAQPAPRAPWAGGLSLVRPQGEEEDGKAGEE